MEEENSFQSYSVDHQFLLVGENALPNFVSASLLMGDTSRLYLVHTEGISGTGHVAQHLARSLSHLKPTLIAVDYRDVGDFNRRFQRYLEKLPRGSIGLNYTGGTKMMAVHLYKTVEDFCDSRGRKAVFSYLDADTLELIVEARGASQVYRRQVVEDVKISLLQLFRLHGIQLKNELHTEPAMPELPRSLAEQYSTVNGASAWKEGRKILQRSDGKGWENVRTALARAGVSKLVVDSMETEMNLDHHSVYRPYDIAQQLGMKDSGELRLYLDGTWLESWTLYCLKALGYEQRAMHITGIVQKQQFEVDAAALRGYQLFTFSCTVQTTRRSAKLKLLELLMRARQLGGEEACVALVCPYNDPEGLQDELPKELLRKYKARVFGMKHLPHLQTELRQWFADRLNVK